MSHDQPTLLIFEGLTSLPAASSYLYSVLSRSSTHIVLTLHSDFALDSLKKQIDSKIVRGVNVMQLKPLSELQSTQRLVHGIVSECEFAPYNEEQRMVADVAEKTMGSPDLVEVSSALLSRYIEEEDDETGFLEKFYGAVCCSETPDEDPSMNNFAEHLLKDFDLSRRDFFLLSTLSLFGAVPIPRPLVEMIQLMAIIASPELPNKLSPLAFLTSNHLLSVCPSAVIQSPVQQPSNQQSHLRCTDTSCTTRNSMLTESDFYFVPQIIADAVLNGMDEQDLFFSYAAAYRSLGKFYTQYIVNGLDEDLAPFMAGLAKILADSVECHKELETCYKEVYRTYLLYAISSSKNLAPTTIAPTTITLKATG